MRITRNRNNNSGQRQIPKMQMYSTCARLDASRFVLLTLTQSKSEVNLSASRWGGAVASICLIPLHLFHSHTHAHRFTCDLRDYQPEDSALANDVIVRDVDVNRGAIKGL